MKKFLLVTTLLLTLVLGGCQYLPWNKSAETPSYSTSDTSAASPEIDCSYYNKVLDDYEKVAKGTLPTGMDVNPLASQVKSFQGFYTDVVYHKTDLNNDGVDELLLALEMKSGEKSLLDIRTLKDGKVIRLTNQENRFDQIGERMTVGILPDNSLLYRGSSSATSHIYAYYQFSEDGQSLVKVKEAQELADLGVGSPISLETLSWKSVSDKLPGGSNSDKGTAATASSTTKTASGKMDINAIKNGDFSSIEGRWSTGNGGQDLVFSKNGLIEPAEFYVDINDAVFKDGYIITSYKAPTIRAQLDMIPAGVVIPTVTEPNFVEDASDTSRDRMIIHQAPHAHGNDQSFFYKVK